MNFKLFSFLFIINITNCCENTPNKETEFNDFWKSKKIMNIAEKNGKNYKAIQFAVTNKVLEYYKSNYTLKDIQERNCLEGDSDKVISMNVLAGKCMSRIYKLNND